MVKRLVPMTKNPAESLWDGLKHYPRCPVNALFLCMTSYALRRCPPFRDPRDLLTHQFWFWANALGFRWLPVLQEQKSSKRHRQATRKRQRAADKDQPARHRRSSSPEYVGDHPREPHEVTGSTVPSCVNNPPQCDPPFSG